MTDHFRPDGDAPVSQRNPETSASALKSTSAVDTDRAESAVRELYRRAMLPQPSRLLWFDSPLQISVARKTTANSPRDGADILPALLTRLGIANQFFEGYAQTGTSDAYRALVHRFQPLRRAVSGHLVEDDRRIVAAQFVRRLLDALGRRHRPSPWNSIEVAGVSQFDAPYIDALLDAEAGHAVDPTQRPLLAALGTIAHSCGWCVPHADVVWLSKRPTRLALDDRNRLHCPDGPALAYGGDWQVHAWKGVRLQPWMIEDRQSLTVSAIHGITDPVMRRCMIEIMSPERFVAGGGALLISRDDAGTLWHRRWRNDAWAAVEVVNGSPEPDGSFKHYFLQVPADMRTARQAVAWTYHMSERQYARLDVRT